MYVAKCICHILFQSVHTSKYNTITHLISSTLTFGVDIVTQDQIFGGHWWCVVEFEMPGSRGDLNARSVAEPFISGLGRWTQIVPIKHLIFKAH